MQWIPQRTLAVLLHKFCVQRKLNFENYTLRDSNGRLLDANKTLGELDVDIVVMKSGIYHSGWLSKKGTRRYFVLKDEFLYWFSGVPTELDVGEFSLKPRGKVALSTCSMNIHPERKWTIILTPGGGTEEVLILKGSNDEDTTEWYDMLKRAIVIAFKKSHS